MRVIAGLYRGRRLEAPAGLAVRPTPDRVREALFDILGERVRDSSFLDLFAGSGAVGIEALSRGAERVVLVENQREALRCLEGNLVKVGIADRVRVIKTAWPGALRAVLEDRLIAPRGDASSWAAARKTVLPAAQAEAAAPVEHERKNSCEPGNGTSRESENAPSHERAKGSSPEPEREITPGEGAFSIVFADPPYARAPYPEILESLSEPGLLRPGAVVVVEHELRAGVPEQGGTLGLTRVARYGRVGLAFYAATQ